MTDSQLKNSAVSSSERNCLESNKPSQKRRVSKILTQPIMCKGKSADVRRECEPELLDSSESDREEGPASVDIGKALAQQGKLRHGP